MPADQTTGNASETASEARMEELRAWVGGNGRYAARDQIEAALRRIVRLEKSLRLEGADTKAMADEVVRLRGKLNPAPSNSGYQTGWNDGYSEGFACKLADVSAPFMPSGTAAEIEHVADWLQRNYGTTFGADRSEAIGMARGMIRAARGEAAHG